MTDSLVASKGSKWELTYTSFRLLLQKLDPDPHVAGEKYERLRLKLIWFFRDRRCLTPDEQTDKTLDRVAQKLLDGEEIENINAYVYTVARYIFQEYLRTNQPDELNPEILQKSLYSTQTASSHDDPANQLDKEKVHSYLDRCLEHLEPQDRMLIVGYYEGDRSVETRKRLADQLGIAMGNLATKACRIREKLFACIKKHILRPT